MHQWMNGALTRRSGNQSLTLKCQISRAAVVCCTFLVLVLLGRASFLEFREWSEAALRELWDFVIIGGPRVFEIPSTSSYGGWFSWK